MERIRRRLALITIALIVVLASGTAGFVFIENYPVFDAFYMTLTTVTTVGYGEIRPLSHVGRVFNSFLIMFGASVVLLAIGAMTQTIIELELNQSFGKRRVRKMIEKLEGHFIVCGFGRVGRGAADELHQKGAPFVVVDNNEEKVERAIQEGMLAVLADASRDEVLREVGIDRAKGLIATLASDADNLFLILTARTLNSKIHLTARVAEQSSEEKLRRAGADFVFAPYNSTGHRMAQALLKPHVQQFIDFTTQNLEIPVTIEQVRVSAHSGFIGATIEGMQIRSELGVIVLAIRTPEGKMVFNPPPDSRISVGDHLIVMGQPEGLQTLEHKLNEAPG
ncbi:MAG TPA: potassium channel protein [Bryobacteraceae bacterium]|nr:potassium channel protein [Bryobacteraceae bacterium]